MLTENFIERLVAKGKPLALDKELRTEEGRRALEETLEVVMDKLYFLHEADSELDDVDWDDAIDTGEFREYGIYGAALALLYIQRLLSTRVAKRERSKLVAEAKRNYANRNGLRYSQVRLNGTTK